MRHTQRLLEIMARLRDPKTGCPWDLEQTNATIAPYTIEEAYEVAEAIAKNDPEMLRAELGDLLFQVVFYAQLAKEKGVFDFEAIAAAQCEKMIRRHPHVFGDTEIKTAEEQTAHWEKLKQEERQHRRPERSEGPHAASQDPSSPTAPQDDTSLLDDIPHAFPALLRAEKLQKRAAQAGFDWPDVQPILDKVNEEFEEVKEAIESNDRRRIEEEVGDLLFVCVNLARHCDIRAEEALRQANHKFERRFRSIEAIVKARGATMESLTLAELDALWDEVKKNEAA